jgi:hypothetical protein
MPGSPEYERLMSNGLHSSFLGLICAIFIIFSWATAFVFTVQVIFASDHNLWLLLAIPISVVVTLVFDFLGQKAQDWGMRNLNEAEAIRIESMKQRAWPDFPV